MLRFLIGIICILLHRPKKITLDCYIVSDLRFLLEIHAILPKNSPILTPRFFQSCEIPQLFFQVIKYKLGLNIDTLLTAVHSSCKSCLSQGHTSGFHLHLLVFSFVHQFNSRIWVLFHSLFACEKFRRISTTFQHHFKICLMWFLHKKVCRFQVLK